MKKTPNPLPQINCDLGEGVLGEELIFPWIDACSVACGGHYGSEKTILTTLELAKEFGKKAGAHPSYPDLENFGRKSISISNHKLKESLTDQIRLFVDYSQKLDREMDHIKFHGALYNDAARDKDLADFLTDMLADGYPETPIFVPPHSFMQEFAALKNLPHRLEIFGDRAYLDNYQLAPRNLEASLFTKLKQVNTHLTAIFSEGMITTVTGNSIPISADTICFHGDNPGILEFLPFLRQIYWT
jgi:UPF0271 protein